MRSPRVRPPDVDAALQLVEVERVQRMAGLQHHVVGDVDQVRDRAHPARGQAHAHRERARADLQAGDDARDVARAGRGVADLDVDAAPGRQRDLADLVGRRAACQRAPNSAATSRAMPTCDSASGRLGVTLTSSTSSSRPIWRARSAPAGRVRRQNQDSVTCLADPELDLAAQHAGRRHAPDVLRVPACGRPAASRRAAPTRPCRRARARWGAAHHLDLFLLRRRPRRRARATASPRSGAGARRGPRRRRRPATSRPRRSIDSTSSPTSVSCCATLSAVTPGLSSTSSRSQLNETFIGIAPGSGRRARRTSAGRRPRTSASPSATAPCRTRSRSPPRVVADRAEHVGVHHARAADLDPAAALAQPAGPPFHLAVARAQVTGGVDLGRRLGEREVAGAQADAQVRPEEAVDEVQQRPLEIGERDALVDAAAPPSAGTSACAWRRRRGGTRCRARRSGSAAAPPAWCGSARATCASAGCARPRRRTCPACRARGGRAAC